MPKRGSGGIPPVPKPPKAGTPTGQRTGGGRISPATARVRKNAAAAQGKPGK